MLAAIVPVPAPAAGSGFVIHMSPLVSTCADGPDDATLTCVDISEVGDGSSPQSAWIIAFGWEELPGWRQGAGISTARFGIAYDPTVSVVAWVLCTGGSQNPQESPLLGTWPESHTANEVAWPGAGGYVQPSGFARIGYFIVAAGSVGSMAIAPDLRLDPPDARMTSGGQPSQEFGIPVEGFSRADVGGTNPDNGVASCQETPSAAVRATWAAIKAAYR